MGLLEDIKRERPTPNRPTCTIATIVRDLDDEDRAAFETVIYDYSVPCSAIGRALRGRGVNVSDQTLNRHRRGICACPR